MDSSPRSYLFTSATVRIPVHTAPKSGTEFIHYVTLHFRYRRGLISTVAYFSVLTRNIFLRKWNRDNGWKAISKHKIERGSTFYVYAWPFIQRPYFIYARKICVRTHGKITRQWKSTFTKIAQKSPFFGTKGLSGTVFKPVRRAIQYDLRIAFVIHVFVIIDWLSTPRVKSPLRFNGAPRSKKSDMN